MQDNSIIKIVRTFSSTHKYTSALTTPSRGFKNSSIPLIIPQYTGKTDPKYRPARIKYISSTVRLITMIGQFDFRSCRMINRIFSRDVATIYEKSRCTYSNLFLNSQ